MQEGCRGGEKGIVIECARVEGDGGVAMGRAKAGRVMAGLGWVDGGVGLRMPPLKLARMYGPESGPGHGHRCLAARTWVNCISYHA